MNKRLRNNGFSLTEVLMAAGILVVGFMLIAGTFPVGIKLTSMAAERTIAAIAADEAFAKIRLYGVDFADPDWPGNLDPNVPHTQSVNFQDVAGPYFDPNECRYPSADIGLQDKKYYWSALCRYTGNRGVQTTVFISRITGASLKYPDPNDPLEPTQIVNYPEPIPVLIKTPPGGLINEIDVDPEEIELAQYINENSVIVSGKTGQIMRVLERDRLDSTKIILADTVDGSKLGKYIWVVPPSVGPIPVFADPAKLRPVKGRYPCVGVFQRVVGF